MTTMAVVGTLAFNFQVVVPLFVERTFRGGDTEFTVVYSVLSLGSLVGALATARRQVVEVAHVVAGCAAFGVATLALAAAPSLRWSFPLAVVVGASSVAFREHTHRRPPARAGL